MEHNCISVNKKGTEGWRSFITWMRDSEGLPFPAQFDEYRQDFATGTFIDVTTGLFVDGIDEYIKDFLKEDGTYPTGICEDYAGNWMLRRTLKTDEDGTEYVAEGTVSKEGFILDPIHISCHKYNPHTVYPLNGSWQDVWKIASKGKWDRYSSFFLADACYVNLVVPLSFFEYVQHYYEMYSYGELSSRTFYTGLKHLDNGHILLDCFFDNMMDFETYDDIDDKNMFMQAVISEDGKIVEPLHIDLPKDAITRDCYLGRYGDYLEKIANMPQPWL